MGRLGKIFGWNKGEGLPRFQRHLIAHEDAYLAELLPLAVEGEQGTDLEEPGGDVEGFGQVGPLAQVLEARPSGNTVVDDEQIAAALSTDLLQF